MADASGTRPAGDFADRQTEFAAHLRDPAVYPAPADIEDRRMQIYRDLFFNNISSFLAGGFRVLRSCLDDATWRALMRDFYRDHSSKTPLFTRLYKEFVTYLAEEREQRPGDPPFLADLAHYEWTRIEFRLAADPEWDAGIDPDGDLLDGRVVLSPLARVLSYRFPVNEITRDNQPAAPAPAPFHFLVYRDAEDRVKFAKLNIVSARLFELLDTRPEFTGRAALELICDEMQHRRPDQVIAGGREILRKWRDMNVVLGTKQPSPA